MASCIIASHGGKTTVSDILSVYYPVEKSVTVTVVNEEWDLDDGAQCNEAQINAFFGLR